MRMKLNLSAPWYIARNKLAALFELDPQVTVGAVENADTDNPTVTVKVSSHAKAVALSKVLPSTIELGNVMLSVIIENTAEKETFADILRTAFAYNPLFRGVEVETDPTGTDWTYLVAEADFVQFPADNLSDYRRNITTTVADAATEILSLGAGVSVCTAALDEN